MRTLDIVARASRNLRRAKMRTFLTSVAIAVGGFAITCLLYTSDAADDRISVDIVGRRIIENTNAHLTTRVNH